MRVLRQSLIIGVSLLAGLAAGMHYAHYRAGQALDEMTLYDFATGMHSNMGVVKALRDGRQDDALAQLEYAVSTSLAYLCAEARRPEAQFDLYVSQAIADAAEGLQRQDCLDGRASAQG